MTRPNHQEQGRSKAAKRRKKKMRHAKSCGSKQRMCRKVPLWLVLYHSKNEAGGVGMAVY